MSTRTILVGYDTSAGARAAAKWALDQAARTGSTVEFLYAYHWPTWAPATATVPAPAVWPDGETDRAVHGMLNELVANARTTHPDVRTRTSIVYASAALTLIERSAEAGLIVVGSRGSSGVAGLLGSVSVAVSAQAHCPVVVAHADTRVAGPVVVGVDESASSHAALMFAVDQAVARGTGLRVIRAWPPVTGLWEDPELYPRVVPADEREPFEELIAGLREKNPGLDIAAEAVLDHPAAVLSKASRNAQLVVVGTRGRGPVTGILLGSVSQHVLRHTACSVAVVHEGDI
ncbi:universal stress protein [Paractinoplanes hotanensis]|uniref:Universal stress protein n=1 Tax=Paractinoplanes hotanensis TaxID=2906497 RepID=A0ABT0YGI9_9ACTN|nr:universal stress protein [Actinoplanes hotanensis]MCM4085168.1 universal stress protein [Actinoplanes hotanensis]